MNRYIILIVLALLVLSCGNCNGGKINKPYDGGHGIGIDTATIHQIEQFEDSLAKTNEEGWD